MRVTNGFQWSDEQVAHAKELYCDKGWSYKEIAGVIPGASPANVSALIKRCEWRKPAAAVSAQRSQAGRKQAYNAAELAPKPRPSRDRAAGRVYPIGPRSAVLAGLPDRSCHWPVGKSPPAGEMHRQLMCGEPVLSCDPKHLYCEAHLSRAYPLLGKK